MINATWRKRLSVWRNRLYLYPPPDPLPHSRLFWLATGLVTFFALLFAGYFIFYLTGRHDAYMTNAEDLGIMDQAIWNTVHGSLLHQTICNIINDTNCSSPAGITRFAIHFEPILLPISLLYLLWPDPKTLLVLQTLVVASGAFPAFWLARLRLRNELAGVAIALLYLLYPAQQQATIFDFHAVTFTASLLLFMLYFMYTRRTVWLFVFAVFSMACKEEIPLVVAFYGLWTMLFQQRWRSGLALLLLASAWAVVGLLIVHLYSPTGSSLLVSRYTYLGHNPLQIALTILLHPLNILKQHVLEHDHLYYLRLLLTPAGYLPLLAPWVLVLALPTLTLNLLSSDPQAYSGLFQYNAEMVPVLIFSTIEAVVLLLWLVQWGTARLRLQREKALQSAAGELPSRPRLFNHWVQRSLLVVLLGYVLFSVVRADAIHSSMPFAQGFQWPQTTPHNALAQRFIDMIPSTASVSAQSALAPHISHRLNVYLFPYADDSSDYVFLDVTSDVYPFFGSLAYIHEVKKVLLNGDYGVLAAQDGYLLLKRGLPSPGLSPYSPSQGGGDFDNLLPNLPDEFCSFIRVSPQQVIHPLQVTFSDPHSAASMDLVGFNVAAANTFSVSAGYMQVTTYWKVNTPTLPPLRVLVLITDAAGGKHFASTDFPAASWCPTNTWEPGMLLSLASKIFSLHHIPTGLAQVSLALLPLAHPSSTMMDEQDWLPLHIVNAPGTVPPISGRNALPLATITIVP